MTHVVDPLRALRPLREEEVTQLTTLHEPEASPLTAEERADCMDEFCACGGPHDADAVRKQYKRLRKQLEAARNVAEGGNPAIK